MTATWIVNFLLISAGFAVLGVVFVIVGCVIGNASGKRPAEKATNRRYHLSFFSINKIID
jgi:hypothetical protein